MVNPAARKDVQVTTLQVEIKALRIGSKQMTIAAYNQLISKPLFNPQRKQNGVPWGWVERHSHCSAAQQHLHIVWQEGSDLRTATVRAKPFIEWPLLHGMQDKRNCMAEIGALVDVFTNRSSCSVENDLLKTTNWRIPIRGYDNPLARVKDFLDLDANDIRTGWAEDGLRKHMSKISVDFDIQPNQEEIHSRFVDVSKTMGDVVAWWNETYSDLQALPQLFIAV